MSAAKASAKPGAFALEVFDEAADLGIAAEFRPLQFGVARVHFPFRVCALWSGPAWCSTTSPERFALREPVRAPGETSSAS